jgi:hypothetical protein
MSIRIIFEKNQYIDIDASSFHFISFLYLSYNQGGKSGSRDSGIFWISVVSAGFSGSLLDPLDRHRIPDTRIPWK